MLLETKGKNVCAILVLLSTEYRDVMKMCISNKHLRYDSKFVGKCEKKVQK